MNLGDILLSYCREAKLLCQLVLAIYDEVKIIRVCVGVRITSVKYVACIRLCHKAMACIPVGQADIFYCIILLAYSSVCMQNLTTPPNQPRIKG